MSTIHQSSTAGLRRRLLKTSQRIALIVTGTALLGACNPGYLREGAGVGLAASDIAQQTELEDVYLGHLCRQAGLSHLGATCDPTGAGAGAWSLVTQAGLNDIDRRCDGYLAWIDAQKKNVGPGLQQISDLRTATTAILVPSGAGVTAIAVVAAAFGLASSTFANFNSRLISELDHSTLQAVVFNRQQRFREQLAARAIADRPAAIYVLRSYLRICMPFTIETEINSTLTTLARTGLPDPGQALTSPRLAGSARRPDVPLEPRARVADIPARPAPTLAPHLAPLFSPDLRQRITSSVAQAVLRKLCASDEDIASGSPRIAELIRIFKEGSYARDVDVMFTPGRGAALTQADWRFIAGYESAPGCGGHRNYFEKTMPGGGMLVASSRGLGRLARFVGLPALAESGAPPRADEVRAAIRRARACLGPAIAWSSIQDELTPAMWDAMGTAQPGSCAAQ